jgi:hypothetical protein
MRRAAACEGDVLILTGQGESAMSRVVPATEKFEEDALLSERLQISLKRAQQGEKRAPRDSVEKMAFGDAAECLEKAYCAAVALEAGGLKPSLNHVLRMAQFSVLDDISNGLDED